jgi:tetratricopeptide (TPR) repeat protein
MPPPPAAAKKQKQPPPAPKIQLPRAEPKPLPGPPGPAALAKLENARQIRLGREAFAGREYSRAERRFHEAIAVLPQDHLAYFLLAQARVALGKYQEAVASIHAGMRLQTNWPTALFWPRDLYESNGADYTEHLKRLADAQALYADDPVLLFLYGYELWFDDRREEARPFFQRAAVKSADPTFSHRFVPLVPRLPLLIW